MRESEPWMQGVPSKRSGFSQRCPCQRDTLSNILPMMPLHPVLLEKLNTALASRPGPRMAAGRAGLTGADADRQLGDPNQQVSSGNTTFLSALISFVSGDTQPMSGYTRGRSENTSPLSGYTSTASGNTPLVSGNT